MLGRSADRGCGVNCNPAAFADPKIDHPRGAAASFVGR
jgi:hypothetical protein